MKKVTLIVSALALSGIASSPAQAAFSIGTGSGVFSDAEGNPMNGSTFMVIGDNDGDGEFGTGQAREQSTDSFTVDDGNEVLATREISTFFEVPGTVSGTLQLELDENKPFMFAWYDLPFDSLNLDEGPGPDVDFGTYRDENFVAPSAGATIEASARTAELGVSNPLPAEALQVSNTTVPTPSTGALVLATVGGISLIGRSRRRA